MTSVTSAPTTKDSTSTKTNRDILLEEYAIGAHANHDAYPLWLVTLYVAVTLYCMNDVLHAIDEATITVRQMTLILLFQVVSMDFNSGLTHIVLDNPFFADSQNWYGIIEPLAKGFQEHHLDPKLIYKMSVAEHLRPMCTPLLISYGLGLVMHNRSGIQSWLHISSSIGLFLMQMAHRWSHMHESMRPTWVTKLQNAGLLLSPKAHLRHHQSPYQIQFCISSGIFNRPLNYVTSNWVSPLRTDWVWILLLVASVPHFLIAKQVLFHK